MKFAHAHICHRKMQDYPQGVLKGGSGCRDQGACQLQLHK
jgi:hypothetical protein